MKNIAEATFVDNISKQIYAYFEAITTNLDRSVVGFYIQCISRPLKFLWFFSCSKEELVQFKMRYLNNGPLYLRREREVRASSDENR